jgi:hypothetical protein
MNIMSGVVRGNVRDSQGHVRGTETAKRLLFKDLSQRQGCQGTFQFLTMKNENQNLIVLSNLPLTPVIPLTDTTISLFLLFFTPDQKNNTPDSYDRCYYMACFGMFKKNNNVRGSYNYER